MKQALIIFVRHPELGRVKTRIAARMGNEMALSVYKKLLQHTLDITKKVEAEKFVFYAGAVVQNDLWQREGFFKMKQAEADLGARMQVAFEQVFTKGYESVCIIGSDCYELTSAIITDAFHSLKKNDVVIGPAKDGGYYLLGMRKVYPLLFQNKTWSTATVFEETIQSIEQLGLTYSELPLLTDVDEAEDVPTEWLTNS